MVRSVSKGIASAVMPPTLMNKLAKLSAQERKQIIGDFAAEVFHGLDPDPGLVAHLRKAAVRGPAAVTVSSAVGPKLSQLASGASQPGPRVRWPAARSLPA
jgi:hypothetical protein